MSTQNSLHSHGRTPYEYCDCDGCNHAREKNKRIRDQESELSTLRAELAAAHADIARLREALERIATFDHAKACKDAKFVPIYECCCYSQSQWQIARAALAAATPPATETQPYTGATRKLEPPESLLAGLHYYDEHGKLRDDA